MEVTSAGKCIDASLPASVVAPAVLQQCKHLTQVKIERVVDPVSLTQNFSPQTTSYVRNMTQFSKY